MIKIFKGGELKACYEVPSDENNQKQAFALFIIENKIPVEQDSLLPKLDLYAKALREAGYYYNFY